MCLDLGEGFASQRHLKTKYVNHAGHMPSVLLLYSRTHCLELSKAPVVVPAPISAWHSTTRGSQGKIRDGYEHQPLPNCASRMHSSFSASVRNMIFSFLNLSLS